MKVQKILTYKVQKYRVNNFKNIKYTVLKNMDSVIKWLLTKYMYLPIN